MAASAPARRRGSRTRDEAACAYAKPALLHVRPRWQRRGAATASATSEVAIFPCAPRVALASHGARHAAPPRAMSAAAPAARRLVVERVAGLLCYEDGLARQAALAAQRIAGLGADTLLLCEVRLGSTRGTSAFRWLRDALRRKRRCALTLKPPPLPLALRSTRPSSRSASAPRRTTCWPRRRRWLRSARRCT